jgi:hypothetical protein
MPRSPRIRVTGPVRPVAAERRILERRRHNHCTHGFAPDRRALAGTGGTIDSKLRHSTRNSKTDRNGLNSMKTNTGAHFYPEQNKGVVPASVRHLTQPAGKFLIETQKHSEVCTLRKIFHILLNLHCLLINLFYGTCSCLRFRWCEHRRKYINMIEIMAHKLDALFRVLRCNCIVDIGEISMRPFLP